MKKALKLVFSEIQKKKTNKAAATILPSSISTLDSIIGGFDEGELIVIGSRPSVGKTSFSLGLLHSMSTVTKIPSAYISYETNIQRTIERVLTMISGIQTIKIRKGELDDTELVNIERVASELLSAPVMFLPTGSGKFNELKQSIQAVVNTKGSKIVFIDYLQLISSDRLTRNRDKDIAYIIRELKLLAKCLNIAIVLNSQLNRSVEHRSGFKRPQLIDLRDSGAIENEADKILFVHRPETFGIDVDEEGNSLKGLAEIVVAKNRIGPTGEFLMRFERNTGSFTEIELDQSTLGDIQAMDIFGRDAPF